ncbi:MAG: hypothetical protein PHO46_02805 [Thermoguttaceae bacterium]|jgi:Leucine-rich repeat (LRR) protein|nr:hypothetical protein [Thermoguttaceae bacterium]
MNLLIKRTSAVFLVGCIALLSGCRESKNPTGAVVGYQKDEIAPTAEDTSDQTMYEPAAAVDPNIDLLAQQYDELHPKRVAVLAPAPVAPPAPPAPPLAAKEDIEKAKTRVSELRGSFKTAKNGAITSITVESQDATLDDMKLFGRLLDLESYTFLGSNFTDEFLAEFKDLQKVTTVTIQNAAITVETLNMLGNYPELTSLDIRRDLELKNKDLEAVVNMPKLEKLFAYYNGFGTLGVRRLAKSTTLKLVDLRGCSGVDDSACRYLAEMPTLEELYLRFLITNDGVEYLAAAPALKFVEFQDCPIDNRCSESLVKFPALVGLRVFRCNAFDDGGIKQLADMKFERLELRDLNISSEGILALKDMTTLKTVELSEMSSVDAEALKTVFSSWKDMTSLNTFTMPVDDEVVKTIVANMPNLKSLTIRASIGKLTDAGLDEICKLSNLETLDLRENAGLTLEGMMKLANIQTLRRVYIKGTKLGETTPEAADAIKEFKKINPKCSFSN